jgi:hypothetical protein
LEADVLTQGLSLALDSHVAKTTIIVLYPDERPVRGASAHSPKKSVCCDFHALFLLCV